MECSSCSFDGIPKALADLTRTYSVSVRPTSRNADDLSIPPSEDQLLKDSSSNSTRQVNAVEYKILREFSKRKQKKDVIAALNSVSRKYAKIVKTATAEAEDFNRYAQIAAVSDDKTASDIANSIAADFKSVVIAMRSMAPKLKDLKENTSAAIKDKVLALSAILKRHESLVDLVRQITPDLQKICLACSRASNDDNLSRYGQVFVSIDAMNSLGLISSGADPTADIDLRNDPTESYNGDAASEDKESSDDFCPSDAFADSRIPQTAHDYLLKHAIVRDHSPSDPVSRLPAHIEDTLRKHLASFNELSVFEKILCISQWANQSFSDFATMKWVPPEIKKVQSKQFIRQRWTDLVQKFPIAAAMKNGAVLSSPSSGFGHYSSDVFDQQELSFDDSHEQNQNQNVNLTFA